MNPDKNIGIFNEPPARETGRPRRNRLLLIGIDQYRHLTPLEHPVKDCQQLFELLQEHYGFGEQDLIRALYDSDATRQVLYDELFRLKGDDHDGEPLLSEEDNLVLVFSGHGYLDERSGRGYWAPVDAPVLGTATDLEKEMISVGHLVETLSKVRVHHILLIVDACFAGAFARMELDVPQEGDWNNPEEKPSRWALTAGRNQVVADRSPFAEALQQVLNENTELHISIKWIGSEIERRVGKGGKQLPWCGAIVKKEFEGGEFFFHRQTPAPNLAVAAWQTISIEELPQRLRHGSRAHLERLKKGCFQFLRIEKLLLTGLTTPGFFETKVKAGDEVTPLYRALQPLWRQDKRHAVVLGEGGMGKTVSVVRLWEDMLGISEGKLSPIPIFIALNEYNAAPPTEKNDFVLRYIARQCLGMEVLADDWKNALWQVLQSPLPNGTASVLLLLDGFNEITVEKSELLLQLNKIAEQAVGVQMLITSRYVEIQNFTWAHHSEILEMLPLEQSQIEDYLRQAGLPQPENPELLQLFSNPMMLTLYAGSSSIGLRYKDDHRFRWLPISTQGELLWNFHEAQLARFLEDVPHDPDEQIWLTFLLRHLLPYIAFLMEKEGQFFIHTRRSDNPGFNIKSVLEDAYLEWNSENFTDTFPLFEGKRKVLGLGIHPDDLDGVQTRYVRIRQYLVEKLHLLVAEDEVLRFVHQNFRDFYAACQLRNDIEVEFIHSKTGNNKIRKKQNSLRALLTILYTKPNRNSKLPQSWVERPLPVYLWRMFADIEGEHYIKPYYNEKTGFFGLLNRENLLTRLLDACRGQFQESKVGFSVWNVIKIMQESRGTLAGANLSNLELGRIQFNGISLMLHFGKSYFPTILEGSKLHGGQFLFEGHRSDYIRLACYSPCGNKILSASDDYTLKEWSIETTKCIKTYKGHDGLIWHVCYNSDGKKVLSSSNDHTIKEWSVKTGKCLVTFTGHTNRVVHSRYSPSEEKVLSTSDDGTIKEWSVDTGQCLQTFEGHNGQVWRAYYSPDREKILSISADNTIKEWSIKTGYCLNTYERDNYSVFNIFYDSDGELYYIATDNTNAIKIINVKSGQCLKCFNGHNGNIHSVCYSPNKEKILSSSYDKTIKEWSLKTGQCLNTFIGHSEMVLYATYHSDGKKILSTSHDRTIKEWSLEDGQCLNTIEANRNQVYCGYYSPNNKKIIIGSDDNTIKEWHMSTGICLQAFRGHKRGIWCVCYHPSGQRFLSGSSDNTIKEWLIEDGSCLQTFSGHQGLIRNIAYNTDGKKALSVSWDNSIKEWLVKTGECLNTFPIHGMAKAKAYYSIDGESVFVISNKIVHEWSVETSTLLSITGEDDLNKGRISEGKYEETFDVKTGNTYIASGQICMVLRGNEVIELQVSSNRINKIYSNEIGILIQSVDFRHLHPASHFTEDEKSRLRRYGAIFNDEDERRWKEAVADAYGDLDDNP